MGMKKMGRLVQFLTKVWMALIGFGGGSFSIKHEVNSLSRFCKDPLVAFDVGANKGLYTSALTKRFPNLTEIHAFEPNKTLYSNVLTHLRSSKVKINNLALGSTEGEAILFSVPGQSGLGSLTKRELWHHDLEASEQSAVEVSTLDKYCQSAGVVNIDILKIDVEGHELDVLAGATKMLDEKRIQLVQFEFGGCNVDTRTYFRDFWNLLNRKYGFDIYRITPFGLTKLKDYSELDEIFTTTNYIATLP
jgi:FkbM family methyltransferase